MRMLRDLSETCPFRARLDPIHKLRIRVESARAGLEKAVVAVKQQRITHKHLNGDFYLGNLTADWITQQAEKASIRARVGPQQESRFARKFLVEWNVRGVRSPGEPVPLERSKGQFGSHSVGENHKSIVGNTGESLKPFHPCHPLPDVGILLRQRVFRIVPEFAMRVIIAVKADREALRIVSEKGRKTGVTAIEVPRYKCNGRVRVVLLHFDQQG